MRHYYINKDNSGNPNYNNEVHHEGCPWFPLVVNREYLGYFSDGAQAVQKAKQMGYSRADGCATCCPEAHRG